MEQNVGHNDKIVRIVLGAVSGLISLGILTDLLPESVSIPMIGSPILGLIAIALLTTAFTNKCGLYSALGIKTKN
jgi:hypothetical protein